MAKEHAKSFLEHIDRDPELQKQVRDMQTSVAELARKHGYEFSLKDWHDSVRERWDSSSSTPTDPDTCCVCIP